MNIPILLILFRLLLAPVILYLAYAIGEEASLIILVLMYLGLISDILDGIVARKQNKSTTKLRRMDSQADLVFWLSIGVATWFLHPNLIQENRIAIWVILAMEAMVYVVSLIKFKRETCTHALLSKLFGLALIAAFTSLIGFAHAGVPFYIAIILGIISHIDRILITLILPKWTHDVPSAYHAIQIRKGKEIKRYKLFNG